MNKSQSIITDSPRNLKKYILFLFIAWTLVVAGLSMQQIYYTRRVTEDAALYEVRAYFKMDQFIRQWSTSHGGVYVPVDENTPPNPYLSHVEERDIQTPSGRQLTLMNPPYMMRQLHEQFQDYAGFSGHITSLNPLRPENGPDEWETRALLSFEQGEDEIYEFTNLNGEPYLRLMQPMITQEGCLKCHGIQGYRVGDVRGGVSFSIPMQRFLAEAHAANQQTMLSFLILWVIGAVGIVAGGARLQKAMNDRLQAEQALQMAYDRLEERVAGRTAELSTANQNLLQEILMRKDVERAIEAMRHQNEVILNAAGVGIIGMDVAGKHTVVNATAAALLGYDPDELVGRLGHDVWHHTRANGTPFPLKDCPIHRHVALGLTRFRSRSGTDTFWRKDGRRITVEYVLTPVAGDSSQAGSVIVFRDISRQKETEERLFRTELRYASLFENSPIALWEEDFSELKAYLDQLRQTGVTDFTEYFDKYPDEVAHCAGLIKMLEANQAALALFEVTNKQDYFQNLQKIFVAESLPGLTQELLALIGGQTQFTAEMVYQTIGGRKINAILNLSIAPGCEQTWARAFVSILDITKRKLLEESLRKSLQDLQAVYEQSQRYEIELRQEVADRKQAEATFRRYEFIVNTSPALMTLIDRQHTYAAVSDAYCHAHNKNRAGIIGRTVADVWGNVTYKRYIKAVIDRCLAGEAIRYQEWVTFSKLGRRYVDVEYRPYRNSRGDISHVVMVSKDITDFQKVKVALEDSLSENQQLLQTISSIIIGVSASNRITHWNVPAEVTFGLSEGEMVGQVFHQSPLPWDWHPIMESMIQCRTKGHTISLPDVRYARPDGQDGFLNLNLSPLVKNKPGLSGFLIVGQDVTEQKILQGQLLQAQKLESIGQLAAGIAHEINTPVQYTGDSLAFIQESYSKLAGLLTTYRHLAESVRANGASVPVLDDIDRLVRAIRLDFLLDEIPAAIDDAQDGVARITSIVQAMKEFSHPGVKEKTALDVNRVIRNTLIVARNAYKYVADVETNLADSLPLILGHPNQISQVFLNIIVNAAQAIEDAVDAESGERGTITIATRHADETVEIRISDTGTGIPDELKPRIFEIFFTTKDVGRGTGQGLFMAHQTIVDRHDGTIGFESEVGRGTTFIITLPIAGESEAVVSGVLSELEED